MNLINLALFLFVVCTSSSSYAAPAYNAIHHIFETKHGLNEIHGSVMQNVHRARRANDDEDEVLVTSTIENVTGLGAIPDDGKDDRRMDSFWIDLIKNIVDATLKSIRNFNALVESAQSATRNNINNFNALVESPQSGTRNNIDNYNAWVKSILSLRT